jgi:hypothetical protein
MTSNTAVPNALTSRSANFGPMPLISPDARYFCMPSAVSGCAVFSTWALNCWPCWGSTAHQPRASTHSPARTSGIVPTTATRSRRPRTCTCRTAKPVSGLWNVTRSIVPATCSISVRLAAAAFVASWWGGGIVPSGTCAGRPGWRRPAPAQARGTE